jgi:hypothetical protein
MYNLIKKQIKESVQFISPHCPYLLGKTLMEVTNKDYMNWLRGYVFNTKLDTLKLLREKQCLFIHIPKCGGVSINNGLLKVERGMGHLNAFEYLMAFGKKEYKSLFKFSFVRNPWDRLVSGYFFMKQGGYQGKDKKWFESNIGEYDNFDDFVKKWVTPENVRRHIVFTPQVEFIKIGNQIKLDFIGKCEKMDQDINYVANHLGVKAEKRQDNNSLHPCYQQLYTSKSKDIVFQVYREDIKKLKYEF